jgi:hypothetical protein
MNRPSSPPSSPEQPPSGDPRAERRRSPRCKAYVPVLVYGYTGGDGPFHEEAYSTVVNDHGALLVMTTPVPVGERLLLMNKITQVEQECSVISVGRREDPSVEIAVELTNPAAQLWRITAGPDRVSSAMLIESRLKIS